MAGQGEAETEGSGWRSRIPKKKGMRGENDRGKGEMEEGRGSYRV